jgi:hypothetical protein
MMPWLVALLEQRMLDLYEAGAEMDLSTCWDYEDWDTIQELRAIQADVLHRSTHIALLLSDISRCDICGE